MKKPAPGTSKRVAKRAMLDGLKGLKVIARNSVDGFYYEGRVIKSTNARHAVIAFNYGEDVTVPTRYVIPRGGAIASPNLQIGDYVLAFNKSEDNGRTCYVPGMIIGIPVDN